MDKVLNPALAPFSADRAAKTTPGAIALTWGLLGVVVGAFVLK